MNEMLRPPDGKAEAIAFLEASNGQVWYTMSRKEKYQEWKSFMSRRAALGRRTWVNPWEPRRR